MTFARERLATAMGDAGCLSVFGRKAVQHRLFAEHLSAEMRVRTEGQGRTVDDWKLPARRPDNHWLDCVVGCAAAGSMEGAERMGALGTYHNMLKRRTLSLLEKNKIR